MNAPARVAPDRWVPRLRSAAGGVRRYRALLALLVVVGTVGYAVGDARRDPGGAPWRAAGPAVFTDQLTRTPAGQLVAAGSGLWVEEAGATTWTEHGPFSPADLVFDVTPAGSGGGPVYVGAMSGAWTAPSIRGPYRRLPLPALSVRRIVASPPRPSELWASSIDGFWRSEDAGRSWARADAGVVSPADAWALLWSGGRLYGADADHVYVWTGARWRPVSDEYRVVSLARAGGHLWATSMGDGIWEQAAGGRWRPTETGLVVRTATGRPSTLGANTMSPYCGLFGRPGPGPAGAHVVTVAGAGGALYAGTMIDGIDVSTDGGTRWSPYAAALATEGVVWQVLPIGGRVLAATDEGVFALATTA